MGFSSQTWYTYMRMHDCFPNQRPILISYLMQVVGGTAESNGQLMRGDQIMKVNEQDLSEAKQDQAVAVLKTASGVVQIRVRRYKSVVASSSS